MIKQKQRSTFLRSLEISSRTLYSAGLALSSLADAMFSGAKTVCGPQFEASMEWLNHIT